MSEIASGSGNNIQEWITKRGEALATAQANAGYYSRMIQDTDDRLAAMDGASAQGVDIGRARRVLQEHRALLNQSLLQAQAEVSTIEAELSLAKAAGTPQIQLIDLAVAEWKALQQQIEALESLENPPSPDPMKLANLIGFREVAEQAIWKAEYAVLLSLLLNHEALAALRPVIENAYAAGIRSGMTTSFEHSLITTLAGPDGIRPDIPRIVEAQEEIASGLGIPF